MTEGRDAVAAARELIAGSRSVVALTGAGISTDSGIPDFRGPRGVWTRDPEAEKLATLQHYLGDADVRRQAWQTRLDSPVWTAKPTRGHMALVELERQGRLDAIVTQNIDGLHQLAGSDPGRVIEIHGTAHETVCWSCGHRTPTPEVLERVRAGEDDPRCLEAAAAGHPEVCGGILKSATISFGQNLDPEVLARSEEAALSADLLLAVGSTLSVYPAAGLVPLAKRAGAAVVIVNGAPTDLDRLAAHVLRGPIGEVLPAIVPADGDR